MDHLTEQDAGLLEQAASMLEEHAEEQRARGNCSAAEGAACSAHAIRRLAPAMLRAGHGCLAQIEEPAQPALYVSPGQLANHSDPEGPESAEAGRYMPARVTPAGKFTQPLYAGAAPAAVAVPTISEIDWDVLPENPDERARFDRRLTKLYGGDPRISIATALRLWAETRGSGFFGAQCAVFANEIAKMHIAAPALEAPAAKPGDMVAVPRDLIGAACGAISKKRDAPTLLAELRRYTTGDLSRALEAPAAPASNEEAAFTKWFQGEQGKPYQGMWEFGRAAWLARAAGLQASAPDWWRKRADEIEVQVAATGSSEAMRCYTDMRTLLQAAAAPQAPAAPSGLPSGWVPCILTHDGQHPEEVAYGPQIMMDRLKKWLGRYFELLAQKVLAEPVHAEMLAALQAVGLDVVHVGAGENAISDAARAKVEAVLEKIGAPWPSPVAAPAAPAVDASGAVPVVLGKKLFQFSCHQDWVNRAQRAWKMAGVRSEDTICLDQKGRVLRKGLEFARADKEGAFPVVVYLALVDDTAAHDAWLASQAAAKGAAS